MPDENVEGMKVEEQAKYIAGDETRLKHYWQDRNTQMRDDIDRINLVKAQETTDKKRWYTNEPKVFFDTSRALISLYPPKFRLPMIMNYEEEQKSKMNKSERLATGIYRSFDQRISDMGGVSWLWDLAYWVLFGHFAVFNIIEKTTDGIRFRADLWNPMNVYPEWDEYGLKTCIRSYETDTITAKMMATQFQSKGLDFQYKSPEKGDNAQIVNYWLRTDGSRTKPRIWNAIMLNGVIVKPMTLQKKLRRIPVQIGSIGSPDKTSQKWQSRNGESIIYADRDMFDYRNALITLYATIAASQAYPNIVERTKTGREGFKAEQLRGYGSKLTQQIGDQLELIKNATTPQEVQLLLNWVGQKIQEGALPATVYGNVPYELSGFAISQYMATLKYKLGPYLNAMQFVLSRVMTDFLYQYKTGNYGKITLSTGSPADLRRGMAYLEEFSTNDVPERIFVEVNIPITSQFDKTQQILNARQALGPPQFLSLETLWEMFEEVDDFEIERERIKQDMVSQDPFIISMDIIQGLWRRYEAVKLTNPEYAQALKTYIFMKEMEIGARQGAPTTAQGTPSFQRPAEAGSSPDIANAIFRRGPSGLSRRPQTPTEREQSEGRRGVLLSPTGESLM